MSRLKPVLPALRVVGYIAALAIVVVMAVRAGDELDPSQLELWPLPPALVLVGVWWLLLAAGWGVLLTGHVNRADISMWCKTQTLRYLPGGLWAPASRVVVVRGRMLDRLATVGAENVIALCAAVALGGLAFAAAGRLAWLPLVFVLAVPVLAARYLASRTRVAPDRTLQATGTYVAAFAAYAIAAVLVQGAVSGFDDPLAAAAGALVAWAVGLVVIIAPGGVGAREAAYVGLLSGTFPDSELAAAALTLRVVTIFAELAILLVAARPQPEPSPG